MSLSFSSPFLAFFPCMQFKYRVLSKFFIYEYNEGGTNYGGHWVPLNNLMAVTKSFVDFRETVFHSSQKTSIACVEYLGYGFIEGFFHETWILLFSLLETGWRHWSFLHSLSLVQCSPREIILKFGCVEKVCLIHWWKNLEPTRTTKEWR